MAAPDVQLEKQAQTKEHGKDADFRPLRHAIELFAMTAIEMDVCAGLASHRVQTQTSQ